MTTAVDTSVLLDIFLRHAEHAEVSRGRLDAWSFGGLVIADVVYGELSSGFSSPHEIDQALSDLGVAILATGRDALFRAGHAWAAYARRRGRMTCANCGNEFPRDCVRCRRPLVVRQHILSDFIIGGHALVHADRLLTRDFQGYFRTYFPDLTLV